jgi:hypothetical protein
MLLDPTGGASVPFRPYATPDQYDALVAERIDIEIAPMQRFTHACDYDAVKY